VFFQPRRDQIHTPDVGVNKGKYLLKALALQLLVCVDFSQTLKDFLLDEVHSGRDLLRIAN
jgi:hypothetical protein